MRETEVGLGNADSTAPRGAEIIAIRQPATRISTLDPAWQIAACHVTPRVQHEYKNKNITHGQTLGLPPTDSPLPQQSVLSNECGLIQSWWGSRWRRCNQRTARRKRMQLSGYMWAVGLVSEASLNFRELHTLQTPTHRIYTLVPACRCTFCG